MLDYALAKARHHVSGGKQSVYAVATNKRGMIIAEAGNSYVKSHTLGAAEAKRQGKEYACFLHAEVACLVKLYRLRKKCYALYVARAKKDGTAGLAKPCSVCQALIEDAEIEHVFYTL